MKRHIIVQKNKKSNLSVGSTLLWAVRQRKDVIWLVIITPAVNVFWLISCCLQLCCSYATHLRPQKLPQITRHTLCSCVVRHWFNDRAPGVWESKYKSFHKVSFGWITVVFFQFALKKIEKWATIYMWWVINFKA